MITGLLQVARGTSAQLRIQPQRLRLRTLQDVLAHLNVRSAVKSQDMQMDIPNDLPCIYADQERVQQVLINLLDNAIKYTPAVSFISGLHRTTQKFRSLFVTPAWYSEENRDRIFEPLPLKRDEARDGYGIGLALCQRIIRAALWSNLVDSAWRIVFSLRCRSIQAHTEH